MKKVYQLNSCSTCQRILKELEIGDDFEIQNIKTEQITEKQLSEMYDLAGSYEALFSRRSMKYRAWKLNEMELTEADYKDYILKEYTFLKRPVIMVDNHIFIGNAKKNVLAAKNFLLKS